MADDELARLIEQARQFFRDSERLSLRFESELDRVYLQMARELERLLRDRVGGRLQLRAGQALGLERSIREALEAAGYNVTAIAAVRAANATWIPEQSLFSTVDTLRLVARRLLAQGDKSATDIWLALSRSVLRLKEPGEIVDDLAKTLEISKSAAARLFDTEVTAYGRQVEAMKTAGLGPSQPFMYSGPVDLKTRDWCLERVGKVYTREEIDQMDNHQIPNVFLYGGGWNCRHTWMAVESQALRSLQGTSERAEGFDADVQRVRELRRKKAA